MERTDFSPIEAFTADDFLHKLTPFIKDIFQRFGPNPVFNATLFCLQRGQDLKNISVSSSVFDEGSFQGIENDLYSGYVDLVSSGYLMKGVYQEYEGLSDGVEIWGRQPFPSENSDRSRLDFYNHTIWRRCQRTKPSSSDVILKVDTPIISDNYVLFIIISLNAEWIVHYTGGLKTRDEIDSKSFLFHVIEVMGEVLGKQKLTSTLGALDAPQYSPKPVESRFYDINKSTVDRIFEVAAGRLISCYMYVEPKGLEIIGEEVYGAETFHNIKMIAAHKYETRECKAELRIVNHCDIDSLSLRPLFTEVVNLESHRTIRKLLESTGKNAQLVANKKQVLGISSTNSVKDNDLVIRFIKFMSWELGNYINGSFRRIFLYEEGDIKPQFTGLLAEEALKRARTQLKITEDHWIDFRELILTAQNLGHGGILVFTDKPQTELDRFKNACFLVEPFGIKASDLASLTSIDGAVLIDSGLNCHAIGVILDGVAGPDLADPSRGSRYNSAMRYYNHRQDDISLLIIVVSEDGMIDIIPAPKNT